MPEPPPAADRAALERFVDRHARLLVLTGAGISIASGIPAYRDANGDWARSAPIQLREYLDRAPARQRYWARSTVGWEWFRRARPNAAHRALAAWEGHGRITQLVTQNVDRLHQAAGADRVIDLHGRLDRVRCLDCDALFERDALQAELLALNPAFAPRGETPAPDGDAILDVADHAGFNVPACAYCGGMLKPDVVFFGETIPPDRVSRALNALTGSDALLVIGSSLMVYSGFRFCRIAAEHGIPIAAVNPGRTRADDLLSLKIRAPFELLVDAPAADTG
jgi:NAD-dependent SIR2 family protein deacetylase